MFLKRLKKAFAIVLATSFVIGGTVSAASVDDWNIYYYPGAPTSESKQTELMYVSYYAGGFYAKCNSISGANGRGLTITATNCGGIKNSTKSVLVTTTGMTGVWTVKDATTGLVSYKVTATSGYKCLSKGIISINS